MHRAKVVGKAAPLPADRPSGTVPAMTVSGAAAATTMNTIDPTPSLPVRVRGRSDPVTLMCGSPLTRKSGADHRAGPRRVSQSTFSFGTGHGPAVLIRPVGAGHRGAGGGYHSPPTLGAVRGR